MVHLGGERLNSEPVVCLARLMLTCACYMSVCVLQARKGGQPVLSLDLRNCAALSDDDVACMCQWFPNLQCVCQRFLNLQHVPACACMWQ